MGNACLGQPRRRAQLMQRKITAQSQYQSNLPQKKTSSSAVVGESDGLNKNRLKIKLNLITCGICMQTYNCTSRQPQLVCQNNHTYCKQCTAQAYRTNRKCPECRAQMREPVRNRDLYQLVEDNQKVIEEQQLEEVKEEEQGQGEIRITVEEKNQGLDSFWIEGQRVMKIQNNMVWEGFVSQETLPKNKESHFYLKVLYTQFGNIKVGIVGKGYKCQKGVVCKQAVVYHLADGKILEASAAGGQGSEWRGQGEKIDLKSGTEVIITCRVDPIGGKVLWLLGDKLLGQGRFSKFLKEHEFVAYVLLCHKEDTVQLNA